MSYFIAHRKEEIWAGNNQNNTIVLQVIKFPSSQVVIANEAAGAADKALKLLGILLYVFGLFENKLTHFRKFRLVAPGLCSNSKDKWDGGVWRHFFEACAQLNSDILIEIVLLLSP